MKFELATVYNMHVYTKTWLQAKIKGFIKIMIMNPFYAAKMKSYASDYCTILFEMYYFRNFINFIIFEHNTYMTYQVAK